MKREKMFDKKRYICFRCGGWYISRKFIHPSSCKCGGKYLPKEVYDKLKEKK